MTDSVVEPQDVMGLLIQRLPELATIESSAIPGPPGEDERLIYHEMTDVAYFLVDAKLSERNDVVQAVLSQVEGLLDGGTPEVGDLLMVGLLEDLQNILLQRDIPLSDWERWLGPECRRGWNALIKFWGGKMKGPKFESIVRFGDRQSRSSKD